MLSYLIRRVGYAFIMVILVSFVSFVIIKLPPGDFLTQKLLQLQARGDRSARGERPNASGPALEALVREQGWEVVRTGILPDDLGKQLSLQFLGPETGPFRVQIFEIAFVPCRRLPAG